MNVYDRRLPALTGSVAVHLLAAAALLSLAARATMPAPTDRIARHPFVWVPQHGPGGGGGGGGDRDPRHPRAAQKPGTDASTIDARSYLTATPTRSYASADEAPRIVAQIVPSAAGIDYCLARSRRRPNR